MSDQFGLSKRSQATIAAIFKQYPEIKKVILFGSRATGTHREHSDIDFAIIGNLSQTQLNRINSQFIHSDLPYEVDVCLYQEITNTKFKAAIDHSGVEFYPSLARPKI